jgi:hypothetical protein
MLYEEYITSLIEVIYHLQSVGISTPYITPPKEKFGILRYWKRLLTGEVQFRSIPQQL